MMHTQPPSSTHPLIPPTTEDDRVTWLRLLRSRRVGIATFNRLMLAHGSAQAALEALPETARQAGVKDYQSCTAAEARRELSEGARHGAHLICIGSPEYPDLLSQIPDAPPLLWARGAQSVLQKPMIGLVGARNASSLGTRMARTLSADLAEAGYIVVSGLARGIDTCAHLAALSTGTIGVLAGGVDVIYPAENTALAQDILETGALISEQPIGMAPIARHFPARNRIISGLCAGIVIVEAAAKSGSLITARGALDQGRDVMAVPGHPFDARASGSNFLIRDGATLVRSAEDILDALPAIQSEPVAPELPLETPAAQQRSLRETANLHREILNKLGPSPVGEDQLMRDVGRPAAQITPALTSLELSGAIRRAPGGLLARA